MNKNKLNGFTLIELLVVIAIIALLLSIILPSLRAAKELASGAVCVSNQRQLCMAWISYAQDNDSWIVGGSNYHDWKPTQYRWVEYPMNDDGSWSAEPAEFSLKTRKNGIRAGKLFPYTQDVDLYHCPGDRGITETEPEATFRSYSITGLMNGEDYNTKIDDHTFTYRTAITAPGATAKELRLVLKTTEIRAPGNKHVFVEEDAQDQYVNSGSFVLLEGTQYNWWDSPADYHNGSSTTAFADGHAERRRWQDPDTIVQINGGQDPHPESNEDLRWMVMGYLPRP